MYVFDLDGTLADISHRLRYIMNEDGTKKEKPDWDSFYNQCINDVPIKNTIELLKTLMQTQCEILILTGRSDRVRSKTLQWFFNNVTPYINKFNLIMRKDGDHRPDKIVKPELLNNFFKNSDFEKEDVKIIFEDRQSMVDTWRKLGYTCFQVNKGDY